MSSKRAFYGAEFRRPRRVGTPEIYLDEIDLSPAEFERLRGLKRLPGPVVRIIPPSGSGDYGKIRVKNKRPLVEV